MMLTRGLVMCLLLLRCAHGGQARRERRHSKREEVRGERRHSRRSQDAMMFFSKGIILVVKDANPTPPEVRVLVPSSAPPGSDPHAVLCVVTGLHGNSVDLTWSIDHGAARRTQPSTQAARQPDGTYSASSVLFLSAEEWSPQHTYRCSVTQDRRVYWAQARPAACWT
ncbi:immunoglobulin lambda constant 7 [Sardina pilchardus]|uniref:immunoglobulin lambda constant 7 n=1 Tax=Sardina pilchardus TaxID=27697 RepID=UPI002E109533